MAGPNKKYCNSLPENTVLGKVKFSVTDSGYVKRATFLQICMDLYEYCIENRIPFPVILFIDGCIAVKIFTSKRERQRTGCHVCRQEEVKGLCMVRLLDRKIRYI